MKRISILIFLQSQLNLLLCQVFLQLTCGSTFAQDRKVTGNVTGADGTYFKNSEFDWGPKLDGRLVEHRTSDPNSPYAGTIYPYVAQPDNLKDYFQLGQTMVNSLSINTGNQDIQGYFSYTNTESNGIMRGNNLKRNNFNVRITSNLTKKISFDAKLLYFYQTIENAVSTRDDVANPMRAILRQLTNISLDLAMNYQYFDNYGFQLHYCWNPHSNGGENPYWIINRIPREDNRNRVLEVSSLKYEFLEGLALQIRTAIDYLFDNMISERYNDTYTISDQGRYYTGNSWSNEMNNDFLLNYNKNITDNFSLNIYAEGNMMTHSCYYHNTDNRNLLNPNLRVTF